jgi:hypothetical protein
LGNNTNIHGNVTRKFPKGRADSVRGDWYQWEREGGGERVWEGEYSANTMYTCI